MKTKINRTLFTWYHCKHLVTATSNTRIAKECSEYDLSSSDTMHNCTLICKNFERATAEQALNIFYEEGASNYYACTEDTEQ